MGWDLIIKLAIFLFVFVGGTIFAVYRFFFSGVDGAKERLDIEIDAAKKKQLELSQKVKEADKELEKTKAKVLELESKTRGEIEAEATKDREKLLGESRAEAEEIIMKAQTQAEKLLVEAKADISTKIVDQSTIVLQRVLNEKNLKLLDDSLIADFVGQLKDVDMSKINPDVNEAEIVTARGIDADTKNEIAKIVTEKLGRKITINATDDPLIVSGALLKFGSMLLDGSLRYDLREEVGIMKTEIEKQVSSV